MRAKPRIFQTAIILLTIASTLISPLQVVFAQQGPSDAEPYLLTGESAVAMVPVEVASQIYDVYYFTEDPSNHKPDGGVFYQKYFFNGDSWTNTTGVTGLVVLDSQKMPVTDPELLREIFLVELGGYFLHNMETPELLYISQTEVDDAADHSDSFRVNAAFLDKAAISALTDTTEGRYAEALKLILSQPDADTEDLDQLMSLNKNYLQQGKSLLDAYDSALLDGTLSNTKLVREYSKDMRKQIELLNDEIDIDQAEIKMFGQKISLLNYLDIVSLLISLSYVDQLSEGRLDELVKIADEAQAKGVDLNQDFINAIYKVKRENDSELLRAFDIIKDFVIEKGVELAIDEGTELLVKKWSTWAFKKYGTRVVGHKVAGAASGVLMVFVIATTVADILFGRDGIYEHTIMADYTARTVQQFQKFGKYLHDDINFSPAAYQYDTAETYRQVLIFTNLASAQMEISYANMLDSARLFKWASDLLNDRDWSEGVQLLRESAEKSDERTLNTIIRPLVIEEAIIRAIARASVADQMPGLSTSFLVVDVSGSMEDSDPSGGTKMDASKNAIYTFLDMINAENQALQNNNTVGLVSFNGSATLNSLPLSDTWDIRGQVEGLDPYNGTNIAAGLEQALSQIKQAQSDFRSIILLSDGIPTVSWDGTRNITNAEDFDFLRDEILQNQVADAAANNICIHVIGLGDASNFVELEDGTRVPELDVEFLQQIAAGSGCGEYFHALDAQQLVKMYVKLRHESVGDVVAEIEGTVAPGETSDPVPFQIGNGHEQMVISLNWEGSTVDLVVYDPKGEQVTNSYPNAQIVTQATSTFLVLESPMAGEWSISVFGQDVPSQGEFYYAVISTRGEEILEENGRLKSIDGGGGGGIIMIGVAAIIAFVVYITYAKGKQGKSRRPGIGKKKGFLVTHEGKRIPLHDGFTLGRGSQESLILQDSKISRQHAIIRYSDGHWVVGDAGSKSGVFLNGFQVQTSRLKNGDRIGIGSYTLVFQDQETSKPTEV